MCKDELLSTKLITSNFAEHNFCFADEETNLLFLKYLDNHIPHLSFSPQLYKKCCISFAPNLSSAAVKKSEKLLLVGICSKFKFIDILKPLLLSTLERFQKCPQESTLAEIMNIFNSINTSKVPWLRMEEKIILKNGFDSLLFDRTSDSLSVVTKGSGNTFLLL